MAVVTGTAFDDDGIFRPILNGTALNDSIFGLDGDDILQGFGGNDLLDGGTGVDTMTGGTGNDTYVVDNAGDVVVENAGQGTDRVSASISYSLGANVENLTLTGTAISGTGNTLNNTITGNASNNSLLGLGGADVLNGLDGNDLLDGGTGVDTMTGGMGNDVYVVDNAGDVVVENAGQGTDRVSASISYSLGANVENLTLTGALNIDGTGNALNNTISGNTGANDLTGLGGNDLLNGNGGNDTILGGAGNDTILGGAGNDLIVGEGGADILTGQAGQDSFRFNLVNQGVDQITDFVVADDTIQVLEAAFTVLNPATGLPSTLPLGAVGAGQFRIGAGAADANDYFIYNPVTGNLFFDRNGSGAGNSVQIAQLPAGLAMTAADIVVVP